MVLHRRCHAAPEETTVHRGGVAHVQFQRLDAGQLQPLDAFPDLAKSFGVPRDFVADQASTLSQDVVGRLLSGVLDLERGPARVCPESETPICALMLPI